MTCPTMDRMIYLCESLSMIDESLQFLTGCVSFQTGWEQIFKTIGFELARHLQPIQTHHLQAQLRIQASYPP